MALTKQRRLFIEHYLKTFNASDAARKAGYSEKTAYSIGHNLLKIIEVSDEIDRRIAETAMSANEVLLRLAEQARASITPFVKVTDDGFVYFDFSHPDAKDYMHLIKKIKTKRSRRLEGKGDNSQSWEDEWVEVELHDSQSALSLLARYHGLLQDKIDMTSKGKELPPVNIYIPHNGRD